MLAAVPAHTKGVRWLFEMTPGWEKEAITPELPFGKSRKMTVAGHKGQFNFDLPAKRDSATPGPRYAFETEKGHTLWLQLERENQGGRWEETPEAEEQIKRWVKMRDKEGFPSVISEIAQQWPNADDPTGERLSPVGLLLLEAVGLGRWQPFGRLKEKLAAHNTNRQISNPQSIFADRINEFKANMERLAGLSDDPSAKTVPAHEIRLRHLATAGGR